MHSRTYNDPRPTTDAEELTRLLTLKDLNAASWKQKVGPSTRALPLLP